MYYSQFEQDEFLEKNAFKGYKNGFFVDVGAHDGVSLNNTLYYETNNHWSGINIEPIKTVFDKLATARPNCVNLNCAVSNSCGVSEFLLNEGYTEMISGLKDSYQPQHHERLKMENELTNSTTQIINVTTRTLESIFDEYNVKHVNYLTIDVEGGEFEVIKSINFDKVFIDIIGFENNYNDFSIPIAKYLEDRNYRILDWHIGDVFMIHKNSEFNT